MLLLECLDGPVGAVERTIGAGQPEFPPAIGKDLEIRLELGQRFFRLHGIFVEALPGRCRHDTGAGAGEKRHPHLILERLDALAEPLLADVALPCRYAHALCLIDCQEIPDLPRIHGAPLHAIDELHPIGSG